MFDDLSGFQYSNQTLSMIVGLGGNFREYESKIYNEYEKTMLDI